MKGEPWWVVRTHEFGHFVLRAESRVMARMAWETQDDCPDSGRADEIAWIEGPFRKKPTPMQAWET